MNTRKIGSLAEEFVCEYLKSINYLILKTNWCFYGGEIDIIAKEGGELVFVEVKSVRGHFCNAHELFNKKKQSFFQRAICRFLLLNKSVFRWRRDLITVTGSLKKENLVHYKNI